MPGPHRLLQQAIMVDTETLGLTRGSGMHELAVYNLEEQSVHEYILKPNMVQVANSTLQETTRLATNASDVHRLVRENRWQDIMRLNLLIEGHIAANATEADMMNALREAQPWLHRNLANYPHLRGEIENQAEKTRRLSMLKERGKVREFSSQVVDPADLLKAGGDLQKLIEGKTVWLANAAFDSKQVGALVGGLEQEGVGTDLKSTLQTSGPTNDPFYVTGVKVNQARVLAQQTGDWTRVWKAYLEDTPKADQTAVRDIQDVLRSMMSYGQKLGLAKQGDVYWGTSLDLVYRLMGSLEEGGKGLLTTAETHRAAEDLAIHSRFILERALNWTSALQAVEENTKEGQELLAQASKGSGALYEAAAFFKRQEMLKPDILKESLIKRLGRAQLDILEQGQTWQMDGWRKVSRLTQTTPDNQSVKVPFLSPNRVSFSNMDDVVKFLVGQNRYGPDIDIATEMAGITRSVEHGEGLAEKKRLLAQYLDDKASSIVQGRINAESSQILKTYNTNIGNSVTKARSMGKMSGEAAAALSIAQMPAKLKNWGMFAGGLAITGAVWSMASGNAKPVRTSPSLVTYDYQNWLSHQADFYDQQQMSEQQHGMSERGLAGYTRGRITDFGSPYQGIMGSQIVFHQQDLLNEREKWLREQYGAVHYDANTGLFGMRGVIARSRHQGYSYIPDGKSVANGYQNLRGHNLMKINLGDGDWKIKVEDADTVVLQRAGITGAVKSIFGLNKGYSFRLAGIDAPEIAHPGGYRQQGQPHAYQALEGLKTLLGDNSNVELVFDPTQTTYGRTMGVIFSGGKNLNYEMIKRGYVGHLPYGKAEDSMIDYQILKGMETGAAGVSRGMWQHPYWKVMYDVTKNGDRPTFNTLTKKEKIVENISSMDMVGMMELAQDQGFYNTAMAIESSRIGKFRHRGVDEVRPVVTGRTAAHYNSYMHSMQVDLSNSISTHGTGNKQNKFSVRGGYKNLDKALVLDSMGHTNSVWSKRKLSAFDRYDSMERTRRYRQAATQRAINNTIFETQQKHYEM